MVMGSFMPVHTGGHGPLKVGYIGVHIDTVDRASYTFTGVPLGASSSSRYILIAIAARAAATVTINSLTVGGISSSIVGYQFFTTELTAFAIAAVPSGATGDVVISLSGIAVNMTIAVYSLSGLVSLTPVDTVTTSGSSASPSVETINSLNGGAVFGVVVWVRSGGLWRSSSGHAITLPVGGRGIGWSFSASDAAWTGATKDMVQALEGSPPSNVYRASIISLR